MAKGKHISINDLEKILNEPEPKVNILNDGICTSVGGGTVGVDMTYQSTAFMQTYILKKWMVSTIRRPSSAALAYGRMYYETLVWELNEKEDRVKIIDESSCYDDEICALKHHQNISRFFLEYETKKLVVRWHREK
jgi:hypothetical protein